MSWANALGSILGSFSGSFGGGTDTKKSMKLMAYQDQLARQTFQWKNENGWNFMRQGLVNADYNPILAIGQSPIDAALPNATANNPTASIDGASSMQAQTAKKMSDSQIMVNKATASKTAEEALTQQNIRSNYDSQTMMNMLASDRIKKLLPYEERKLMAETLMAHSMVGLNNANAAAAPINAQANKTNAEANERNSYNNIARSIIGTVLGGIATYAGAGAAKNIISKAPELIKVSPKLIDAAKFLK